MKSFVRFCEADRAIRVSSPVETPQLIAIFHAALADSPASVAGLAPGGTVIVNTTASPDTIRRTLELGSATVATLDALGIAVEERTRVNTAMLGAVVSACPFIDPDAVRETIRATFSRRHPEVVDANLRTFDRGNRELLRDEGRPSLAAEASAPVRAVPAFGYLEAPIGGAILEPANSIARHLSTSREGFVPELLLDKCVHCGLCDIVCPDLCLVWEESADGVEAARDRLPLLQGVPEVHRGLPDRRDGRAPRGAGLGRCGHGSALLGGELSGRCDDEDGGATDDGVQDRQRDGGAVGRARRLPPDGLLPDHAVDGDRRAARRAQGGRGAPDRHGSGDGEHGAAGICYGAAVGGGRVFNATSSQGLLYSLEYPVQSGTRFPMLLDLATRTVTGR